MTRYLCRWDELPIFVGYGQQNSITVLDLLMQRFYGTSYLNMQPWAQGIFLVPTRVFARFQQSCTLEASLQIFWNSIGSLNQTLY